VHEVINEGGSWEDIHDEDCQAPLVADGHIVYRAVAGRGCQERLKAAGFNPGYIDGVLGPRTQEALRRYQASQGLPTTGALDEATRKVLLAGDLIRTGGEAKRELWLRAPPGGA
jgi:hypothetical protein